jgi:hypothetical protein
VDYVANAELHVRRNAFFTGMYPLRTGMIQETRRDLLFVSWHL